MVIAQKLRQQNMAAYIIYMFQLEDTLRACGLDIERVRSVYLSQLPYSAEEMKVEEESLQGLIRMMHEEGCEQVGHVQVTRNTILLMTERHQELLKDPRQPFYSAAYYKALPFIVELRSQGNNRDKDEIENCLDAVYGATLLRMQGKELSEGTQQALQPITHLLELLSEHYNDNNTES